MRTDERLDDITRARMWSRVEDRLAEPARRRRIWPMIAIGGAVAAVAAAAMVLVPGRAIPVGAPPAVAPAAPVAEVRELAVPAGAQVSATLGDHGRVTLIGPARLRVVSAHGDQLEVRLDDGVMLAELEPSTRLRVRTPNATSDVVASLFRIEASAEIIKVAVVRGEVVVHADDGRTQHVGTGQRWTSDAVEVERIDDDTVRALEAHEHAGDLAAAPTPDLPAAVPAAAPATPDHASVPVARALPAAPTPTHPSVAVAPSPDSPPAVSLDQRLESGSGPTITPEPEPATPAPAPPAPDPAAEDIYRRAEAAIRAGELGDADALLAALITSYPADRLVDEALFERGRLAYRRGAWAQARHHLDALLDRGPSPLREPAHWLTCRIAIATGDLEADTCVAAFRRAHPTSPHDAEALALLIGFTEVRHGCDAADVLIDEYLRRYPSGPYARDALERRARCQAATH
jgi:TolA-binding protein